MRSGILDNATVTQALQELPGWQRTGDGIAKTFVHDDFRSAMTFVDRVADAAEAANHHPDIDIRWNKVTLALTSHSAGGLTSNDITLAHRSLLAHPLL
jgi:4a-hydroxytetrahydrobiopterin dehydratase